jgi:hypothetical protein
MEKASDDEFVRHKVAPEHGAIVAHARKLMKEDASDAKEGISYRILACKQKRTLAVVDATKNGTPSHSLVAQSSMISMGFFKASARSPNT